MQSILECTALALDGIDENETLKRQEGYKRKEVVASRDPNQIEEYPVVVIDGFLWREGNQYDQLWSDLSDWAALLVDKVPFNANI